MKSYFSCIALITFLLNIGTTNINANIFPTNPDGSAIFTPNQQVVIEWNDDGKAPNLKAFGKVQVDFMTGADLNQVALEPIGTVLATEGKLPWVVPEVDPPGKFYFLRFSNGKVDDLYTTRFTISDINGKYPAEVNPPPAVGKNLGKIGKVVAKGDPNGKVPKQVGVGNPDELGPKQPTAAEVPKAPEVPPPPPPQSPPPPPTEQPKNVAKTPNNATTTAPAANNVFPSTTAVPTPGNNSTSSALSINNNSRFIGGLTLLLSIIIF